MKKIFTSFLVIVTILGTMCVFATEESQIIEIDNYEDYEALFSEEEQISDEEYDEMYEEQMKSLNETYDKLEMPVPIKAKVIKAEEPTYLYEEDYIGFLYKTKKQEIEVKLLEGEYEGERVAARYSLMADTFLNMEISELKAGDVIYVNVEIDEETGELYAQPSGVGFNVERKAGMIILAIITVVLVIAFGKDRGILSVLLSILIIAITLLIFSEQIYLGTAIIALALLLSDIVIAMIVIQKLGLTKDAIWAGVSSAVVIVSSILIAICADYMLKNNGATFDAMIMVENIVKRNIDFHHMFIAGIILILSAIVPYVACAAWKKCTESNETDFNKLLDASKDAMTGKIEILTMILMILLMPKLIYLYSYKYTANEIMNSDIITTELIKLFVSVIAIALTVPITAWIHRFIAEKNIQENK